MKKCKYCDYEWKTRKENPKACPRCKRRFDYPENFETKLNLNAQFGGK
jgi:rubrerythrin